MALTRTQINDYVAKMHGTADLGSGGVLALKDVLGAMNDERELITYKTTDQLLIGSSFADVSGIGFSVVANKSYGFCFNVIADADATTTGIDIAVSGPAGYVGIHTTVGYWTGTFTRAFSRGSSYDLDTVSTSSAGSNRAVYTVEGILINGATAGTLVARIKREAVGTGPNVRAGSYSRRLILN